LTEGNGDEIKEKLLKLKELTQKFKGDTPLIFHVKKDGLSAKGEFFSKIFRGYN